jgi:hypothetical protein
LHRNSGNSHSLISPEAEGVNLTEQLCLFQLIAMMKEVNLSLGGKEEVSYDPNFCIICQGSPWPLTLLLTYNQHLISIIV